MGPAWWIPGAHLQTAWARIARSRRLVTFDREVLTTPDDDDLVLDHVAGPPASPRVLILRGLEGSAYSLHTQGLALLVARAGWRGTVINFRSCARDARDIEQRLRNRRPRLYHSGETADLDFVVRTLVAREPATTLYALGSSLPFLARIAVPTLCLSSEDDPLIPGETAHWAREAASPEVTFEITSWGGHTGFVSGSWPWRPSYWAEDRAIDWLRRHAAQSG